MRLLLIFLHHISFPNVTLIWLCNQHVTWNESRRTQRRDSYFFGLPFTEISWFYFAFLIHIYSKILPQSSCLHCTSIISKHFFIVPTDAHYYKIIEMLRQFKIMTLAPTCFGSRRNHHQGAVLCWAKTTDMVFFCARRYRRSQCYGGISACCAGVQFTAVHCTPTWQADMPP